MERYVISLVEMQAILLVIDIIDGGQGKRGGIVSEEQDQVLHPRHPRDCAAAAAHAHQPAEPSVQPPNTLAAILVECRPPIQHVCAGERGHDERGDLQGFNSLVKTATQERHGQS